jgi:hypothetical protein
MFSLFMMTDANDVCIYEIDDNTVFELPRKTKNYTFIKIVETLISIQQLRESYSTRLIIYSMCSIKRIIRTNPEIFASIERNVLGKMNHILHAENNYSVIEDIDDIISILCELYRIIIVMNVLLQKRIELTSEMAAYILKFLFNVCIQHNFSNHDTEHENCRKDLLIYYNGIIDSSIKLLKLKNPKPIDLPNKNTDHENCDNLVIVGKEPGCCCF